MTELNGLEEATQAVIANLSPRYLKLDRLERFANGTQYEGRTPWFAESDVPLWERQPCIVYPIVDSAVRSNVDLVLGEGRFPQITCNPAEDDSEFAESGLGQEESEVFDRFLQEIVRQSRFKQVSREVLHQAQSCGSGVTIFGVRTGRLFLETVKAKWCTPECDDDGNVTKLTIEYPYTVQEKHGTTWLVKAKLYRRVIDGEFDTVFKPADAHRDGLEPLWAISTRVAHGLGFCPVLWYKFSKRSSIVGEPDGHAIHAHLLDQIQGLDFVLSQRHRAVMFLGDPQLIEIGVEQGSNPGQTGRSADAYATAAGGAMTDPDGTNPVVGRFTSPIAKTVRRKSPGSIWQYESEKTKVEYLTLPIGAVAALDDNAKDLRRKICESLSVVFTDAEDLKGLRELSAKALEAMKQRQLDRCDQIRDDFADGWILPAVCMLLNVIKAKSKGLLLAGLKLGLPLAAKLNEPALSVKWPGYFRLGAQDEQWVIQLTAAAKDAGLITRRMGIEKVANIFGIENIDQAEDAILKEQDAQLSRMQEGNGDAVAVYPNGDGTAVRGVSNTDSRGRAGTGSTPTPASGSPRKPRGSSSKNSQGTAEKF